MTYEVAYPVWNICIFYVNEKIDLYDVSDYILAWLFCYRGPTAEIPSTHTITGPHQHSPMRHQMGV